MDVQSLGDLVTRLIGDPSSLLGAFKAAQTGAAAVATSVQASATKIESISESVKTFGSSAAAALSTLGIGVSLGAAFSAYAEKEKSVIRLTAAIEANGSAVEGRMAQYNAFAASIANETLQTKGSVMALISKSEMMGIQSTDAENLVRMSIALAGATNQEASSMFRVAKMIQEGHPEHAKRILGLRSVKNESELAQRITEKLALGWKVATAEAQSTSGRVEKLKKTFAGLTVEVGALVADGLKPAIDFLTDVGRAFNRLDPEVRKVVAQVILAVGAFLALKPVWLTLLVLLGPLTAAFKLPFVLAAAAAAIWVQKMGGVQEAWQGFKAGIGAALGVVGNFIAQNKALFIAIGAVAAVVGIVALAFKTVAAVLGILNFLYVTLKIQQVVAVALWITMTAVTLGWAAAVLLAKGAAWLLSAALATLNVLIIGASFAFVAAGVLALAVGFAVVAAAVWGAFKAGQALFEALASIPGTTGPLAAMGGMFAEWGPILQDVVRAAKVDLPLAWQILQAGFTLAINQIKDLWPPLWKFIETGFKALTDLVTVTFELEFTRAINNMAAKIEKMGDIFGIKTRRIDAETRALNEATDAAVAARLQLARRNLADAANAFSVTESEATAAARAEVDRLRGTVAAAEERARNPPKLPPMLQEIRLVAKFNAAEYGSAEAIGRFLAFVSKSQAEIQGLSGNPVSPAPAVGVGTPDAIRREAEAGAAGMGGRAVGLLGEMRDILRDDARRPVLEVEAARLA